ncbi:MAG: RES family NAD+ phosphorylase [Gemmatimonadota bacterium]|nr:RES family NAD+ phosphorylase [Gemmatimonadota bacterium]
MLRARMRFWAWTFLPRGCALPTFVDSTDVHLWRIANARYPALDGEGARLWGGRWNSPGRPVVYTSSTAALAVLEKLVWVDPDDVPDDLELFELFLPDAVTHERIDAPDLPDGWTEAGSPVCIERGDAWLAAMTAAVLVVPSAVLPEETNALINPRHPEARLARVLSSRLFSFDVRLIQ